MCLRLAFFCESCVLLTGPVSMNFNISNFKSESHSIIHTFKNYFTTVFSVSVFNFSKNKLNPNGLLKSNSVKKDNDHLKHNVYNDIDYLDLLS